MFKKRTGLTVLFLIIVVVTVAYWCLPQQFFVQDEWHHFGNEYYWHEKGFGAFLFEEVFRPRGIRFMPLTNIVNYLQFSIFGQKPLGYAGVSLSLHLINTCLVYLVVKKLTNKEKTSLLASLFFGLAASPLQAVTWLVQHTSTLPALSFSLLAIYFALGFIQQNNKKDLRLSTIFFLVAIFFKETAYFLFPFLIFLLFLNRKKNPKRISTGMVFLIVFGILLSFFLSSFLFTQPRVKTEIFIPTNEPIQRFSKRLWEVPLKAVAQAFAPEAFWKAVSEKISLLPLLNNNLPLAGTTLHDLYLAGIAEILMFAFGIALILFLGFLAWKKRDQNFGLALAFLIFSSLPLLFISTIAGDFTFLESRYLYIPVVGASLVLALVGERVSARSKYIWVLIIVIAFLNFWTLKKNLNEEVRVGRERWAILTQMKKTYPTIPEKTIFYTESDSSFYGLAPSERILPFQSGLGQVLLVWYHPSERFSTEFFRDDFLWDIASQDYQEISSRGFGYFRDFELLGESVRQNNLPLNSVISFSYDSENGFLKDTSQEVRGRLKGYLVDKREVRGEYFLWASENSKEISLAKDGRAETFWDSKLPYINPQHILISLARRAKIAQVKLDVDGNQDQDKVGFRMLVSENKQDWQEVFYAKRYPPNEEGIINLYFEPVEALYVKIEQVGGHQFASWVIHEILLYETVN